MNLYHVDIIIVYLHNPSLCNIILYYVIFVQMAFHIYLSVTLWALGLDIYLPVALVVTCTPGARSQAESGHFSVPNIALALHIRSSENMQKDSLKASSLIKTGNNRYHCLKLSLKYKP